MIDLLERNKIIDANWIFKVRINPYGTIEKHKARLVSKDSLQIYDYNEVFAPCGKTWDTENNFGNN